MTSAIEEVVLEGGLRRGVNLLFHAALLIAFALAMVVRHRRFRKRLAINSLAVAATS